MIGLVERGNYRNPQSIQREFEHLVQRLRGFLTQSFDEDGTLRVADPNLAIVPIGGLVPFAGSVVPPGFLLADGSQVSKIKYNSLYRVLGSTWGAETTENFVLPDLRSRVPLGQAATGVGSTLGETGGALSHDHDGGTLAVASHTHSVASAGSHNHNGSTGSNGDHNHSVSFNTGSANGSTGSGSGFPSGGVTTGTDHVHAVSGSTGSAGSHAHSIDSGGAHDHGGNTGSAAPSLSGTTAAEIGVPFAAVRYIIFAGV